MAQKEPEHSTTFIIAGAELRESLERRAARHQGEINECLETVAKLFRERVGDSYETLLTATVQAMLAMHTPETMNAPTRVIKTQLERAAFLQNERIDLLTISRNLNPERAYRITVEEARRYGMTG